MQANYTDPTKLRAAPGDAILPAWNGLIDYAGENKLVLGQGVLASRVPGGGIMVTCDERELILSHPWKTGLTSENTTIYLTKGEVDGVVPWVNESYRIGEIAEDTGQTVGLLIEEPLTEGWSYVAVAIRPAAIEGDRPTLGPDVPWDAFRVEHITEPPAGFGTGGVLEDADGWVRYVLAKYQWLDQTIVDSFQVVRHSLTHVVVAGNGKANRHFFPPV